METRTRRRPDERSVASSARRLLDDLLGGAGDGAFVVGADGRIVLWNRAAETMLGYPAREVLGRPCCDIFAGIDHDGNRLCYQGCHVMTLARMGEPVQSFDMRTRTRAGGAVWLNVTMLVLRGGEGSEALTVHLLRDVTASKQLLALVHERLAPAPTADGVAPSVLTRREVEVLRLIATGARTRAIADTLHVSTATVRNHVQNILGKLAVHSRLEAVAHATRHRLL